MIITVSSSPPHPPFTDHEVLGVLHLAETGLLGRVGGVSSSNIVHAGPLHTAPGGLVWKMGRWELLNSALVCLHTKLVLHTQTYSSFPTSPICTGPREF